MKSLILPILLLFLFFMPKEGIDEPNLTLKETTDILQVLSSDGAEGRQTNTEGFDKAANYVIGYLDKNGIGSLYPTGYRDTLSYTNYDGYNITAKIGKFIASRETIVLGAHLDHVGKVGKKVYNGANDNATGCTALLQVAKYLNQFEFDKNIFIVFFAGEEDGILGSKDFVRKLTFNNIKPSYMINFEMLGVPMWPSHDKEVYLSGYQMSNMATELNKHAEFDFATFYKGEYDYSIFKRSDNHPFYVEFGIPAHTIISYTEENYEHYHRHTDDIDQIDLDFLNSVINTSAKSIQGLISDSTTIELNARHIDFYIKNNGKKAKRYNKRR